MASSTRASQRRTNSSKKSNAASKPNLSSDQPLVSENPNQASEIPISDAVIISVIRHENGSVGTNINIVGDVRITEIETLLKVALKTFLNNSSE
jgi:hypothetical protein